MLSMGSYRHGVLRFMILGLLFGVCHSTARADAVLLIEEPINFLGHLTSTGHSAIFLDRLCSDDHSTIRTCNPGEVGSIVSRYHGVAEYDWLAMEPMPYLFAVDSVYQIPTLATKREIAALRETYRAANSQSFMRPPSGGAWVQLIGASYRRKIICIRIHTTQEEDLRLMAWLNGRHNRSHFDLFFSNCSDFIRKVLDVLLPGSVYRNLLFDAGMTTPKQLAASLHHYAKTHPELDFTVSVIPQVPGEIGRSGHMYGVTESFVKAKPYLLLLGVLQPLGIGCVAASAMFDGRYNIHSEAKSAPLFFDDPTTAKAMTNPRPSVCIGPPVTAAP